MKIALVNLAYPYGKNQIYFNAALASVAVILMQMGHQVEYIDLNLDTEKDPRLQSAEVIGISVYGAPYIPEAVRFARRFKNQDTTILVGGQVVENLTHGQFTKIFAGTNARQVCSTADLTTFLGAQPNELPNPYQLSLQPVWKGLSAERRRAYLIHEMPLILGQGCVYQCVFCAARKHEREVHMQIQIFEDDLRYLAQSAQEEGLKQINFYATSLDFFQNPERVALYVEVLARVQEEVGIRIRVRCLCCMGSFLRASERIPNFVALLQRSGLSCIGFGVDGTDLSIWKAQKKFQNKPHEAQECLKLCKEFGVHVEVLLVMGFPEDRPSSLAKTVWSALRFLAKWRNVSLRPYLAKAFVPGNDGWKTAQEVGQIIDNPELFHNLDFCAIGSHLTHPRWWHRYASNIAYLTIIGIAAIFKRTDTYPLLPQGNPGLYGRFARLWNHLMPFDR